MAQRGAQRGPDEHLERDLRAHRVAGQRHHGDPAELVDPPGALRSARLHADLDELHPAPGERVLDHLVGPGADPAGGEHQVHVAGGQPLAQPAEELLDVVRDEAQQLGPPARVLAPRPRASGRSTRRSAPAAAAAPGSTSSEPVDRTSTTGRRRTGSVAVPTAAARPIWAGPSTVPAGSTTDPAATSSPVRRTCAPTPGPARSRTRSVPPSVCSTGTIASAPAGSGAPVMIRCTVPAASAGTSVRPAGMSAATGSSTGRSAVGSGQLGGAHRVAVHRGVVERRQRHRGDQVGGQHPAAGLGQPHLLGRGRPAAGPRPRPGVPRPIAGSSSQVPWPRSSSCRMRARAPGARGRRSPCTRRGRVLEPALALDALECQLSGR